MGFSLVSIIFFSFLINPNPEILSLKVSLFFESVSPNTCWVYGFLMEIGWNLILQCIHFPDSV